MSDSDDFEGNERIQRAVFMQDMAYEGVSAWLPRDGVEGPIQAVHFKVFERGRQLAEGDLVAVCEDMAAFPVPKFRVVRLETRDKNPVRWIHLEPV